MIVKEGVANDRLTPRGGDPVVRGVLDPVGARQGVTTDAVALAAVLAQPWADVVLSSAATVAHLHANMRAFDVRLTSRDGDALDGIAEQTDTYWDHRGDLPWG
ncbi:MAG TPA: aldo/keto reductase [Euzebyales bacterium]|nr:aldo/keto reductase [Euzebyales bacterium]